VRKRRSLKTKIKNKHHAVVGAHEKAATSKAAFIIAPFLLKYLCSRGL
jgi:hypothetical protein